MKNVLLVDDEAMTRIGLKTCVHWESLNIKNVFEASNGLEALEVMDKNNIDILITDIKMSVMDGFALLESIKNRNNPPKVIIMSCYNDYETMHQAILYGVKDFLFKPKMYPSDIENSIRNLFDYSTSSTSLNQLLIKITDPECEDYFSDFITLMEKSDDAKNIIKAVNCLIIRLMELDTSSHPTSHSLCNVLFKKLYELKKAHSKEECLAILKEISQQQISSNKDRFIRQAQRFIDENISNPNLSQELVAEHIGLSPSYFCRLFKNELNIGYANYVIKKRIDLANQLLTSTNMKISEISAAVGYSNEQYFSRLYKEYTGHNMKHHKLIHS
mgnify:CR=1 FL=1